MPGAQQQEKRRIPENRAEDYALFCLAPFPAIIDTPPQFGRLTDPAETAETDLR